MFAEFNYDIYQIITLLLIAILLTFGFSIVQSIISEKSGSDHPVHQFLRNRIIENRGRLFTTIPNLLNVSHCAALPLYLHWIIARFSVGAIKWSERMLNPIVNSIHTLLIFCIAGTATFFSEISIEEVTWSALLFALTPQFYHALSARNFGLSARGTGLVLLTAFFACAYHMKFIPSTIPWWVATALFSWLVWGVSTFAQQALLFISVLLLFVGQWRPFAGMLLGVGLFIVLHPKYAVYYLWNTFLFLRSYAAELAPVYILKYRPSIWRDLVYDIWKKKSEYGWRKFLLYSYGNSVFIVFFLNPLAVYSVFHYSYAWEWEGWYSYVISITFAGVGSAIVTSLRSTRFLGEPERYIEVVTPWVTISSVHMLVENDDILIIIMILFIMLNIFQIIISWKLMRHVTLANDELLDVEEAIEAYFGENVRFCCNNEQITKFFLKNKWKFAYYIATGQEYGGLTVNEIYSQFPNLSQSSCERVVEKYRVNCLLLDRNVFEGVFVDQNKNISQMEVIYKSDRFLLISLRWIKSY
ncbi:hypothetical protein [Candidatus Thiosymbion oneisti]|uniref:hypothetical protein n=1 Tax=Candidatus Thiosymbion oneisti TaxID=589554 RepID=UPI0010610966|nr:hypothetical protein [Candidatus Thiosymbion oneisti]